MSLNVLKKQIGGLSRHGDIAPDIDSKIANLENYFQEERLLSRISQAWVSLALTVLTMNSIAMIKAAAAADFTYFIDDPGEAGTVFLILTMGTYALMAVLVRHLKARWFRWVAVVASAFFTLSFIMHEIAHLYIIKDGPLDLTHYFDWIHHFVGIVLISNSVKWARRRTTSLQEGAEDISTAQDSPKDLPFAAAQ